MNAYIIYLDEAVQDPTARWSMYTVPAVDSMTHDDQTASLYSGQPDRQSTLVGVVRLSDAVSVILASEPPQLGGLTQAPVRVVPPRPVVTGIGPISGPTAGGTEVEIAGDALADATGVFFGVKPAQRFSLVSVNGPIHAVTPAGTGVVDVTVTTPGGTSAATAVGQYAFADPQLPVVSSVSPVTGRAGGGETVQVLVNSVDVKAVTAFLFGSIPSPSFSLNLVHTDGTVSYLVQTPPNNGQVNVTVVTAAGSSYPAAQNLFTFVAPALPGPPSVSALSPAAGVTIGGTIVRIAGTDLGDATAVAFGSVAAESFSVKLLDQNTVVLDAVCPCGQGSVPVTVTTQRGTSPVIATSKFAYATPVVLRTLSLPNTTVGVTTAATSATVPLQISLSDLPQDLMVPSAVRLIPGVDAALSSAGLGPQFTVGQFIAACGDVTVSYAIASFSFDRIAGDFLMTGSSVGGGGAGPVTVSVAFKPTAKGYRADVLRSNAVNLKLSGPATTGVLAGALGGVMGSFYKAEIAIQLQPLVSNYVAVLLEGNGV